MRETLLREALAARGSEMDRDERRTNPFGHVRVLDVYAVFLHDPEDRLNGEDMRSVRNNLLSSIAFKLRSSLWGCRR